MNQKGFIDLHMHTLVSDGTDYPDDCVSKAKELGLSAIAITDHNTFGAVEDAMCVGDELGVEVIPAIEIDADYLYPFHFLAYFGGEGFLALQSYFHGLRHEVVARRVESFAAQLKKNGISVDAFLKTKHQIRITDLLLETCRQGHFPDPFTAERELILGPGRIFKEEAYTLQEVIGKVRSAGGLVFWAHPFAYSKSLNEEIIRKEAENLKSLGVDGIEALHYSASKEQAIFLISLAKELGLLVSGGSDYHGTNRPETKFGFAGGGVQVPYVVLERMKEKFKKLQ